MSERYIKLFSLPENTYKEGSPIVINAGNLLKDTQTGNVLAQIKYTNISTKQIKAIQVRLYPADTTGRSIEPIVEHEYLDLRAGYNSSFGSKEAITFSNNSTRGFSVEVLKVVFADNSIWESTDGVWESLPKQELLDKAFGDVEIAKQYRIKYGEKCQYFPQKAKDIWQCSCGTINQNSSDKCGVCGCSIKSLLSFDKDALSKEKEARLSAEQKAKKAKEKKHTTKIIALIVCLIAVAVFVIKMIPVIGESRLPTVVAALERGGYGASSYNSGVGVFFRDGKVYVYRNAKVEGKHTTVGAYIAPYEVKSVGLGEYSITWEHNGKQSQLRMKYSDAERIAHYSSYSDRDAEEYAKMLKMDFLTGTIDNHSFADTWSVFDPNEFFVSLIKQGHYPSTLW